MRALRRHFLYAEQENENSVGDHAAKANVLGLWLARRQELLHQHDQITRYLVLFWDLAKPKHVLGLANKEYVVFFQCVAKALVQGVNNDHASAIAARDWLYDCAGGARLDGDHDTSQQLALVQFKEALFQIAELVLPVESDASMFASFFMELRDAITVVAAAPDSSTAPSDQQRSLQVPVSSEAAMHSLCALKDVAKIRGAFLQKMPPNADHLAQIRGLLPPEAEKMSLKQLLLSYNPRKFVLSRKFSSLFTTPSLATATGGGEDSSVGYAPVIEEPSKSGSTVSHLSTSPLAPSVLVSKESEDDFDLEAAIPTSMASFPALRISVVGPPGVGKSRVAMSLAKRLELQYISVAMAVEDAIASKQARDLERAERKRARQEAAEAAKAAALANAPAQVEGETVAETSAASPIASLDEEREEDPHEADFLLTDDDLSAMLLRGEALSHAKALAILIAFARKTLLSGVGVVLDDVFPAAVSPALTLDYVVSLEMSKEDAQRHNAGLTIAPTSRRVYSARERAMLAECDVVLRERGFADASSRMQDAGDTSEGDEDIQEQQRRRAQVADAMAAAAAARLAASKANAAPTEGEDESPSGDVIEPQVDPEGDESSDQNEAKTAAVATLAQRNEIEPAEEPTVPLGELRQRNFLNRYSEYLERVAGMTSTRATQIVVVLAAQALYDIVTQCLVAITNNTVGLSRSATSRVVLPIFLPQDVAASDASSADQIRWLLYGDWTEFLASASSAAAAAKPFMHGPVDPQRPRSLSRWRTCCPVTSTASPVAGDPSFAAYFSGFVYLLASAAARDQFCASPWQFLKREPALIPAARKIWVLASGPLDQATALALAGFVQGEYVSTVAVLSAQNLQSADTVGAVAAHVADSLTGKNAWVLTDLMPTKEVIGVLHERNCLPDQVIVLSPSAEDMPVLYKTPLERKRHELWAAKYIGGDAITDSSPVQTILTEAQLPVARQSPLLMDPHATQAALQRLLSPLAPRVDSAEDGTMKITADADEENAVVFAPASDLLEEQENANETDEESTSTDKPIDVGYDVKQRTWLANRTRMGETAHFCPVSWAKKAVLVPGQLEFVVSFQQQLYAFAGALERREFEQNPRAFVPSVACATQGFVPLVWLLGVRGCEPNTLVDCVAAQSLFDGDTRPLGVVDDAVVVARVHRRLGAQLLAPLEKQVPMAELYVDELAKEINEMKSSQRWSAVLLTNCSLSSIVAPVPLGGEEGQEVEPPPSVSPIPSPEMIALCFQRDLFPTMVGSLDALDGVIVVQRQLERWRAALPRVWSPPPKRRGGGDAETDESEPPEPIDPAEQEAAETTRLQEQFELDQAALTLAIDTLRARGLALETPISIGATQRVVTKRLHELIRGLLNRTSSLFEYCERVSLPQAQRLLRSGLATVGKHGIRCPVSGTSAPRAGVPAVLYRGCLYFPQSTEILAQCELAPALLMSQHGTQPPVCRISCCVVGPPCVGKTKLARDLARRFDLVYVSPQSAIDWVLQCLGPQVSLWSKLQAAQSSSIQQLDAELVHDAITTRLCSADCQRLGWVLDGYMITSNELTLCLDGASSSAKQIRPGIVFVLNGSIKSVWTRVRPSEQPEQKASNAVVARHERLVTSFVSWHNHRLDLLIRWTSTFGAFHIRQIDTDTCSAWQATAQASIVIQEHVTRTRKYTQDQAMMRPSRLFGVLRSQRTLETVQPHAVFQAFCPVELANGRYHTTLPQQRELCIEWIDPMMQTSVVLWLASEANLQTFCSSAAAFLTEEKIANAKELIDKAPVDASLLSLLSVPDCEFPEMKGYCPVTFQQGTGDKDWHAIVKGSIFYRVSFENKVFFCRSESKRREFISQPTKYSNQLLPIKLPPQLTSLANKNGLGRVEQELSGVLNETLLLLGSARPKFVGVDVRASACFYLALHLKTRAPKALPDSIRAKYRDLLCAFEQDCRLSETLKSAITRSGGATSCGSGLKGARAVKELSPVGDGEAVVPVDSTTQLVDEADPLRKRFDELVRSSQRNTGTNQQPASPRPQNQHFLEYAKPLVATTSTAQRNAL